MTTSTVENEPAAVKIAISGDKLIMDLADGRTWMSMSEWKDFWRESEAVRTESPWSAG